MIKTKKKVKTQAPVPEEKKPRGIAAAYNLALDQIEKEFGLDSSDLNRHRISSGLIVTDLVIGGGLGAGWTSISGQEASGKSTHSAHAMKEALKYDIFVREMRDAEGTVEPTYTGNIFNVPNLRLVFGERNNKGEWIGEPGKVRYYDTNIMDTTFNSLIKTANKLPDKIYRKENDAWYYVLEPKDKRTMFLQSELGPFDPRLRQKTGNLWYPTDNPWPQAFIVIDSLPALITEKTDEQEKQPGGLALNARAFSEFLPRLVGKLRKKNIVILAINQVREKPMVMFGSPFYEPGGNALKFYSSCRNQISARAVPQEWRTSGGSNTVSIEKCLIGDGFDEYAFKHIKNTKNKFATPYREGWSRVWINDVNGEGRGFDLAFDTWMGLQHAGLATEIRKGGTKTLQFVQQVPKPLQELSKRAIEWKDFKALILCKEFRQREWKELGEKTSKKCNIPPLDIRGRLAKMVNTGQLSYVAVKKIKED